MNSLVSLLKEYKIIIPPIQRDYAQGRNTGKIPTIRDTFISNMVEVLTDDNLPAMELDFIYGYTEIDTAGNNTVNIFKPLDGQQRLTTLFLLHWFIANKENTTDEAKPILNRFSYATRQSSRKFCEQLIEFNIDFNSKKSVDEQIVNQPWFYSNWKNDPTIQSMLVVLRTIQDKFYVLDNAGVWVKLTGRNPRIVFHLLSMNDLGLPDDLYIKMNARGKPLTDFEHFKSSFSEIINDDKAKYFNDKIDGKWSDLFWKIFRDRESGDIAKLVDDGFLSFFWYITDILINKQEIEITDEFWLNKVSKVYRRKDENVQFLFDCIDLFLDISKQNECPFDNIFYIGDDDFNAEKTKLFFENAKPNLFYKCVETYLQGNFAIKEQLLLFAFIKINLDNVEIPPNFYRLTRNLLENASDKQIRTENLKNVYETIEALINGERQPANLLFTKRQLEEETEKDVLISSNHQLKETIYKLEDHPLLRGSIGVFLVDNTIDELGKFFLKEFHQGCNYFEISKAMLVFGLYPQKYGRGKMRFGNKTISSWREILIESENRAGFDNTKEILQNYLNFKISNPSITNVDIVRNYLINPDTPKDFRYYYIKYDSFILWDKYQTEGFYMWKNYSVEPYDCTMLFRKDMKGRSWSPFLLEISKRLNECIINNYDSKLQYTKDNMILIISNTNVGFKFTCPLGEDYSSDYLNKLIANNQLDHNSCLLIEQDINGIDQVDRIEKCVEFLNTLNLQ